MNRLKLLLLPTLIIFLLTGLCFWNVLPGTFVGDDDFIIAKQDLIKNFSTLPQLFVTDYWNNYVSADLALYRPLTALSFAFNYALCGLDPWGYHLGNLLIHALNSVMIYWLVRYHSKIDMLALFIAIVFTVHPIHNEAVSNITGRAELLAAFFTLLALIAYSLSKENPRYYWASLLFYFFAMLSKESAITLLGVVVLLDLCIYWPTWHLKIKEIWRNYIGYLITPAIYLLVRFSAIKTLGMSKSWVFWREDSVVTRFYTMSTAFIKYFQLLIWPKDLVGEYDFSQIPRMTSLNIWVIASVLTIIIIFLLGCWLIKKQKLAAFAILFFFITISIVSNTVVTIGVFIAERLLYFPSISICMLVGLGLYWLYLQANLKYLAIGLCSIIIVASAAQNYYRNLDWLSDLDYIKSIVRVAPNNMKALTFQALDYAGNKNFLLAEETAKKAIELFPTKATPKATLARIYYLQERYDESLPLMKLALDIFPDKDPKRKSIYLDLARLYLQRKEINLAIDSFRQALRLSIYPDPILHQELAVVLFQNNDLVGAKEQLEQAVKLKPDFAEAHFNLGVALKSLGKPTEAFEHFKLAASIEPNNLTARNLYGKALLEQGKPELAINEFIAAIKLAVAGEPTLAELHNNLGASYAQLQNYAQASEEFKKSLEIDPSYNGAKINLEKVSKLLPK